MFSKQRPFVPKSLPKPKVKVRTVNVEVPVSKPRTPLNGSASRTPSRSADARSPRPGLGRTSSKASPAASGIKRSADGRPRASNSPLPSSADERGYLAAPSVARKRIRSPATDSERVTFESDEESADDDDWESRLKRRKQATRTDPDRKLRSIALTELAEADYKDTGKPLRFIHAAEVVSLAQGDEKCFPDAHAEDLVVELQYPGSLTRERYVCSPMRIPGYYTQSAGLIINTDYRIFSFELAKKKDKLDVIRDIIRVVKNVKETYITDDTVKADFEVIVRQLERNSNDKILNLAVFKENVDKYNQALLHALKSGAIVRSIDKQHVIPNALVGLILNQVYDRVVTPKVDLLKNYKNGTDNVYGEMNQNFVTQALSANLRMTSKQTFVDLGSGVGNVTLQAALQIGCESWGCEMMDAPSTLAKGQYQEFRARCKLWGIQPGKVRIIHGDFTNHQEIRDVLKRADVVLANNQAFTPDLNETLKIMFLDLKRDCKVVSLKKFTTSSKHNINDIANTILTEAVCYRWPEKGVSWTDGLGEYHISTKKEGDITAEDDFKRASRH